MKKGRILVFSAPSGSGKTTLVHYLMQHTSNLHFSVSATSRPPRGKEQYGIDYFFLTPAEFKEKISQGDFIEYEEVYQDTFYGTLKSQVESQLERGENVILDIDVKGALNVKNIYGTESLTVFIQPPSVDTLRQRLIDRGTDSLSAIEKRVAKATYEMTFADKFDTIIINDRLEDAQREVLKVVGNFLDND